MKNLECRYYQMGFETETVSFVDYKVHNPRLGFARGLYEDITLSASAGYGVRDEEDREDEGAFSGRGDSSVEYKRLALSLYAETGFGDDFTRAERFGFNKFWRAGFIGRFQLLEMLWAEGFFSIGRDRFVDIERRDKL